MSNFFNPLMTQLSLCKLFSASSCDGDGPTNVLRSFCEVESIRINEELTDIGLHEKLFLTSVKFT